MAKATKKSFWGRVKERFSLSDGTRIILLALVILLPVSVIITIAYHFFLGGEKEIEAASTTAPVGWIQWILLIIFVSIPLVALISVSIYYFRSYLKIPKVSKPTMPKVNWGLGLLLVGLGVLIVILVSEWEYTPSPPPAQHLTSPIEITMEEWGSWPDLEAPVGKFAYSEIAWGKKFSFEPQGKVLIKMEGNDRAIVYTPGDPRPNLGKGISRRIGYMSLESHPVTVIRKVEK